MKGHAQWTEATFQFPQEVGPQRRVKGWGNRSSALGRGKSRSRDGGQKEGSEATLGCGVPLGQERQDFGLRLHYRCLPPCPTNS